MTVRARFAPNPSGALHMGSAWIALFNWLFVRHEGGTLLLRIEDTDPATAKEEFVEPITSALRWLGLDWDEGPFRQSERSELYTRTIERLVDSGHVYRCWCTREDIKARGADRGYDRFCRTRTDAPDGPYALRFKTPLDEPVGFHDLILGDIAVRYDQMQDFVVARSDGSATFEVANVTDDREMRITHAIRGNDLLASAGKNVLLFDALGWDPPLYAHMPVVLHEDRRKLSKRKGDPSVQDYRALGYLPEAIVNFLALLSWSSPSGEEFLSREQLVREFTLDRVSPSPTVFDPKKLEWMNQQYLQKLPNDEFERRVLEVLPGTRRDVLRRALELDMVQVRVRTLTEVRDAIRYLHERVPIDEESAKKFLGADESNRLLEASADLVESLEPWTVESIHDAFIAEGSGLIDRLGLHRRKGPQPIRVAITGSNVSLPLWESIYLLGRDETAARLRAALERA